MEWWYFGPVVLAVILFLLVGTVFENRIETAWQQFMERRRAQMAEMVAQNQLSDEADNPPAAPIPNQPSSNACNPVPVNTCAEPCQASEKPTLSPYTEVPDSSDCGKAEAAVRTPSKKSLRSRKSSTILSRQSVVVVKA